MGIVRTVLISTIDLRYPKSLCKNLSLRKFKKTKIPKFPFVILGVFPVGTQKHSQYHVPTNFLPKERLDSLFQKLKFALNTRPLQFFALGSKISAELKET